MEKERVQKFIAVSGVASRRKAEKLIEEGRVSVNDEIVKLGDKCYFNDVIKVDNKKIHFDLDDKIYIVMNKAKGYVCSRNGPHNKKTVFDLLDKKDKKDNLFTVGRLDKDTSGLLIITNDGDFAQKIIHPSSKIKKKYIVKLNKKLELKDKNSLENSEVILDNIKLSSCVIKELNDNKYSISIWEGRKRQIRRMFESKGYKVTNLKRIKIGKLDIKNFNLNEGEYKIVSKNDLNKIFE